MAALVNMHLDIESYSACDLKGCGSFKYASHPSTDILCVSYAFDDGPVATWFPWESVPQPIIEHIRSGGLLTAHNATFERSMLKHVLRRRYNWLVPKEEQWRCTAAKAAAMALPRSLDGACGALSISVRKSPEGHKLLMRMCKPDPHGRRFDSREMRYELAKTRCEPDVVMERELDKRLYNLPPMEQALFHLDAKINERGVRIDAQSIAAAQKIVASEGVRYKRAIQASTDWRVMSQNQRDKILQWATKQGVAVPSMQKQEVESILQRSDLPVQVRQVLTLRQESAKASTAKLTTMIKWQEPDERMRGTLLYHGAHSGRWAGKGPMLHNLTQPSEEFEKFDIEDIMTAFKTLGPAQIAAQFYSPLSLISDATRSFIIASDGNELIAADYSSIESRVLAWIAGEMAALAGFEAFDRGEGPKNYTLAAADIYRVSIEDVTPLMYKIGKVSILAFGYQGGVSAVQKMASKGGILMAPAYTGLWELASEERKALTRQRWEEDDHGLPWEEFAASDLAKNAWRDSNPNIVDLWKTAEDAAMNAVREPGKAFKCGPCMFLVKNNFLWCRLPSGRTLAYAFPYLKNVRTPWKTNKLTVCFMGVDSVTKRWGEKKAYGGYFVENIVQAIARDIMAFGMLAVEAARYQVVLTVHDEIVSEVRKGYGSVEEYCALLCRKQGWMEGLPLAAAGWRGPRFKK